MSFTIGKHTFNGRFLLAPMAGVSEMPFRVLAMQMGAVAAPTEFVSAKGLVQASSRTLRYLRHDPVVERPFWVQLFGGEPESMAEGAMMAVDAGADLIDINMGCPVKKVVKGGAGSALLCDPKRAGKIVEAMAKRAGVPITCKIRAGWDDSTVNCVEMGRILEDSGAAAIAMHARTRAQGYSGSARWDLIGSLKAALKIPVFGNGDVVDRASANRLIAETGVDAVLVGRAALGYPFIFRLLADPDAPWPTHEERLAVLRRHFLAHVEFDGDERHAVHRFRQHLLWYSRGVEGASAFRKRATHVATASEVLETAEEFFTAAAGRGMPAGPPPIECDTRGAPG